MKSITFQKYCFCLVLLFLFVQVGCEQGLEPEPPPIQSITEYGISGTIYFQNWPPPYSVRNLALVAFKMVPEGNLFDIVLDPEKAKFQLNIAPYGVDSVEYELLLAPTPPGMYEYVAVAQQYGPSITSDWRVAGLYSSPGDTSRSPASVFVPASGIVRDINIYVDFNNPPPQP